jgi:hypothetical protein
MVPESAESLILRQCAFGKIVSEALAQAATKMNSKGIMLSVE